MTKIYYASDIHLEFGKHDFEIPKGDILVLAGDITLAKSYEEIIRNQSHTASRLHKESEAFFKECRENFDEVIYIAGNHEPYGYDIDEVYEVIPGIVENETYDLGDYIIVAGTLWTDMNEGKDCFIVGRSMNDFHCVSLGYKSFTPEDAMSRFYKTKSLIEQTAVNNPNKKIIVVTHHAPSIKGVQLSHVNNSSINHGYFTDLEEFIATHPNIVHWIHGHTHIQREYEIAQCKVHANCRGYYGHEALSGNFEMKTKYIEV